jgi:glycosyltransferase involved in cell wall biosynthesis
MNGPSPSLAPARSVAPGTRALLYAPTADGGIAEYMHAQAEELVRRGYHTILLAPACAIARHPARSYEARAVLLHASPKVRPRWLRRLAHAATTVANPYILAVYVACLRPRLVLLDSMAELLAPLWAWPHRLLARLGGFIYAAALHDPVREPIGPNWWHRLSLRAAYAPLSIGLSHDLAAAKAAGVPGHIRLVEVPHGLFPATSQGAPGDVRAELGIAADASVALAFGFVSDRKNLGLAIDALTEVPRLHLIVAGRRGSSQDRPVEFYRRRAAEQGVADRCHFIERYLADAELGGVFGAADFLLLAYTRAFVSQSGVLHVAANWNLPVLAAGGKGPMLNAVRRHDLGLVVEPDSAPALAAGMRAMIARPADPAADEQRWDGFRREASWEVNVDRLLAALDEVAP